MLKAQAIAKNAMQGMQEFFRLKAGKEDFGGYLPLFSRPASGVRPASVSAVAIGGRKFTRYRYE